uniref:Uncharacterized protein n=1 Tax=Knipowitschia caucasica TaxID=637954 RepID=A0AAV2MA74_KNICA
MSQNQREVGVGPTLQWCHRTREKSVSVQLYSGVTEPERSRCRSNSTVVSQNQREVSVGPALQWCHRTREKSVSVQLYSGVTEPERSRCRSNSTVVS